MANMTDRGYSFEEGWYDLTDRLFFYTNNLTDNYEVDITSDFPYFRLFDLGYEMSQGRNEAIRVAQHLAALTKGAELDPSIKSSLGYYLHFALEKEQENDAKEYVERKEGPTFVTAFDTEYRIFLTGPGKVNIDHHVLHEDLTVPNPPEKEGVYWVGVKDTSITQGLLNASYPRVGPEFRYKVDFWTNGVCSNSTFRAHLKKLLVREHHNSHSILFLEFSRSCTHSDSDTGFHFIAFIRAIQETQKYTRYKGIIVVVIIEQVQRIQTGEQLYRLGSAMGKILGLPIVTITCLSKKGRLPDLGLSHHTWRDMPLMYEGQKTNEYYSRLSHQLTEIKRRIRKAMIRIKPSSPLFIEQSRTHMH
jgi:hypothetical protein